MLTSPRTESHASDDDSYESSFVVSDSECTEDKAWTEAEDDEEDEDEEDEEDGDEEDEEDGDEEDEEDEDEADKEDGVGTQDSKQGESTLTDNAQHTEHEKDTTQHAIDTHNSPQG